MKSRTMNFHGTLARSESLCIVAYMWLVTPKIRVFFTGRTEYKDGIGVFSVLKTFQILVIGNIGTGA